MTQLEYEELQGLSKDVLINRLYKSEMFLDMVLRLASRENSLEELLDMPSKQPVPFSLMALEKEMLEDLDILCAPKSRGLGEKCEVLKGNPGDFH